MDVVFKTCFVQTQFVALFFIKISVSGSLGGIGESRDGDWDDNELFLSEMTAAVLAPLEEILGTNCTTGVFLGGVDPPLHLHVLLLWRVTDLRSAWVRWRCRPQPPRYYGVGESRDGDRDDDLFAVRDDDDGVDFDIWDFRVQIQQSVFDLGGANPPLPLLAMLLCWVSGLRSARFCRHYCPRSPYCSGGLYHLPPPPGRSISPTPTSRLAIFVSMLTTQRRVRGQSGGGRRRCRPVGEKAI